MKKLFAILLASLLLAAGCGGTKYPEGIEFEEFSNGLLTFSYPAGAIIDAQNEFSNIYLISVSLGLDEMQVAGQGFEASGDFFGATLSLLPADSITADEFFELYEYVLSERYSGMLDSAESVVVSGFTGIISQYKDDRFYSFFYVEAGAWILTGAYAAYGTRADDAEAIARVMTDSIKLEQ